ncbi:uncharacterized protein LOC122642311 [Telopea speciosissima]|uniref:uncharacterized protein LOC122642311 n=1 Tax=Telopea speciosissima TaxID=54955 RepID=UPI001CC65AAF|nr:uncharacterized protein LOC122642311 [Telopea speciosissima]
MERFLCVSDGEMDQNFIWSGVIETRKAITVKWDLVCKPRSKGGLGVRRLRDVNKALLCKLAWAIKHEESMVIDQQERWVVRDGSLIKFWTDCWLGSESLASVSRLGLDFFVGKSAKVADLSLIRSGHSLRFILNVLKEFSRLSGTSPWLLHLVRIYAAGVCRPLPDPGCFAELVLWWKRKSRQVPMKDAWMARLVLLPFVLWEERNRRKFDNKSRLVLVCSHLILGSLKEISGSFKYPISSVSDLVCARRLVISLLPNPPQIIREVHWSRLFSGWVKFNVDGCSLCNPGRVGVGGVLRNDQATPFAAFSIIIGTATNYVAEF